MASLLDAVNALQNKAQTTDEVEALFFQKLEQKGFNLSELKTFLKAERCIKVSACAGAGKTTALILRILYDYIMGKYVITETIDQNGTEVTYKRQGRILVSTFLKTGAEDIKRQFQYWCNALGIVNLDTEYITFTTLHAEFYAALRGMGVYIKMHEDPSSIVRQIMKILHIRNVTQKNLSRAPTIEEVADVESIFAYYRNRLDDTRYKHPLMGDYAMDSSILETAVAQYKQMLYACNQFDFELLEESLLEYMQKNPAVYTYLTQRYDYIYVDEFQDVSQLQYAVLQPYFRNAKTLIVIGDDDQCIYGWRGSANQILVTQFAEDFDANCVQLTMNYRCGSEILQAVVPSIECNEQRVHKDLQAYNQGGSITLLADVAPKEFLDKLKVVIGKQESLAVLSRTNADLLIPAMCIELYAPDIRYTVSKGVTLRNKLAQLILGSLDLVEKPRNEIENFDTLFKSLFTFKQFDDANKLCKMLSNNRQLRLIDVAVADVYHTMPTIIDFMLGFQKAYYDDTDTAKRNAYKFILQYYIDKVFVKQSSFHTRGRELARFLCQLLQTELAENLTFAELYQLLRVTLPQRIDNRLSSKNNGNYKAECVLSTVHDAKGKEWDSVFLYNDNNGTFPVTLTETMNDDMYEEERRLHYIAWTRAKKCLYVVYDSEKPSPFLLECDLQMVNGAELLKREAQLDVLRCRVIKSKPKTSMCDTDMIQVSIPEFMRVVRNILQSDTSSDVKQLLLNYAERGELTTAIEYWCAYCAKKQVTICKFSEFKQLVMGLHAYIKNNLQKG